MTTVAPVRVERSVVSTQVPQATESSGLIREEHLAPAPPPIDLRGARNPVPAIATPKVQARPPKPEGWPYGWWTTQGAHEACAAVSAAAAKRGVNTLVIGFEGLISYDHFGTLEAYKEQVGREPQPVERKLALLPLGGFVLHGLMEPLVDRFGDHFEFLMFPHLAEHGSRDGVPAQCALAWMHQKGAHNRHLIIVGHSMGTFAADSLARTLAKAKTPVDLVVTLDVPPALGAPVRKQRTTRELLSFKQVTPTPLPGVTVPTATAERTILHTDHTQLPAQSEVFDAVSARLGKLIGRK